MKRTGKLCSFIFLITLPLVGRITLAQDKKATEPAKEAPAAAAAPAEPTTAAPAAPAATAQPATNAADAKAAADEFKAKLDEWKGILKELRTVRQKFDSAE